MKSGNMNDKFRLRYIFVKPDTTELIFINCKFRQINSNRHDILYFEGDHEYEIAIEADILNWALPRRFSFQLGTMVNGNWWGNNLYLILYNEKDALEFRLRFL